MKKILLSLFAFCAFLHYNSHIFRKGGEMYGRIDRCSVR